MEDDIKFYDVKDKYGEFSNFYESRIVIDGITYKTVEHYFQSQKFTHNPDYMKLIIDSDTPMKCKLLASQKPYFRGAKWRHITKTGVLINDTIKKYNEEGLKIREDWEKVKDNIMYEGIKAKFTQNKNLFKLLKETEGKMLYEHTTKDKYWGDGGGEGKGKNMLGKLLMRFRDQENEVTGGKKKEDKKLSAEQQVIYDKLFTDEHMAVLAVAGCGKSFIIEKFKDELKKRNELDSTGFTALTGVAAINIGGTTIHSYLKLGIFDKTPRSVAKKLKESNKLFGVKRIIIDEISMMSYENLDYIDSVLRMVNQTTKPFGGIAMKFFGDFYQLEAIKADKYIYDGELWDLFKIYHLKEIHRQKDPEFRILLDHVRLGEIEDFKEVLQSRVGVDVSKNGVIPTKIYCKNVDVDAENRKFVSKLIEKNEHKNFKIEFEIIENKTGKPVNLTKLREYYVKNLNIPEENILPVGAQVMITYNVDVPAGIVNGTRGVLTGIGDKTVKIKMVNGQTVVIPYVKMELENEDHFCELNYLPVKTAYSITISKSQSVSLDCAVVDLSELFTYSLAYVAISRVRTMEGLSIMDKGKIKYHMIKPNPDVKRRFKY